MARARAGDPIAALQAELACLRESSDGATRNEAIARLAAGIDALERMNRELAAENDELRRRAERRREERDAILDAMVQPVLVFDTAGRVIRANRAATRCMGEEIVGMTQAAIARRTAPGYPDGREASMDDLPAGRALRGERVSAERMDVTDRRGEIRRILISASPLILGGQIFGGVVVWQEITGQVRTIRTLDEERALLRVIIESIPEAIVVADRDARIRMTNPAADRIYSRAVHPGMDAEHFAALHLCHPGLDPCPPDDLPLVRSARHGEIIQGREFAILGAEGELRDLVADSAPIIGSDGQRIGAAGVFQDLTGRREAERALRESEERFRGIFERAGISIVLADTAGRILRVNPAFQKMLGYSADELQQMTILDLTHPEDAAAALAHFQGTLAGRHETDLMQKRYIAKDGRTVWGQLTTSLLRGPDGEIRFLIGMIEDITDRKRDEELRRQAFDQIERNMEQFAILGDHIRHPLQAILARADLMEDEGTAEKIREQVRRIDALVKRLEEGWIESREIREFLRRNELA